MSSINIIGAGLAGCEAALYLADKGYSVKLYEMRPKKNTPAHKTKNFAELVCSNSLKSMLPTTASGLLKQEMKLLGCKLLDIAYNCSVPAGNALAINREEFSKQVYNKINSYKNIEIIIDEVTSFKQDEITIVATGPLTSNNLTKEILKYLDDETLYFFDAIAPIVSADSLDYNIVYRATRYDKGEADYLNCPFSKEEYYAFVDALLAGEKFEAHEFENEFFKNIKFSFYENCTPIEELARRGVDTLRYGVLRPVGLINPNTNKRPFAVLQLRTENINKTSYNLVGCQTMLKQKSQKQAFRLIPGLKNVEILRYGAIHRNTYINSPKNLNANLSLKKASNIFLAGQIFGLEGYTESILGGLLVAKIINGEDKILPAETITGQLYRHLLTENKNFQPMNANFGILPPLKERIRNKQLKKEKMAERAIDAIKKFLSLNI